MARPLRDQAAELLGQEIAAGKLPPGSRLNERDIAMRFGMSRTPAREVLLQLSSAGLVRIEPRQGAVVLNLSAQEIVSMVEILVALEGEAVGLATRRMEPQERREIAETYRLATAGVERMSSEGYSEANRRFHQAIYVGSRNPLLTAEIKKLRIRKSWRRSRPSTKKPRCAQSADTFSMGAICSPTCFPALGTKPLKGAERGVRLYGHHG
jgi:DNA-binding GntR family transcriptional regulator